jgi:hypothetical protein
MLVGKRQAINIPPGVNKDDTSYSSFIYTDADGVRFYNGLPQMIGGYSEATYANNQTLSGVPRTIYSYLGNDGIKRTLIGTNTRLYSLQSNNLYNITPLVTATTAIANSLSTNYAAMGTDTLSSTNGSRTLTLTYSPLTEGIFQVGDIIQISGATGFAGILAAAINASHNITAVTATTISFTVATAANATTTGGGAGIILSTRVITVAQIAHGFANGDRIKILASANAGGFLAADINIENVIRNVSVNAYSYYLDQTSSFATSAVTAAGGALTTVQGQITSGNCSYSVGFGYGGGAYSGGSYGTGKTFTAGYELPRIWSIDRYGDGVILTPGDQGALYEWDGNINLAPTIVTGAPTAINYVFVAANQAVTFGASATPNRVKTSDSLDITNWTIDATSNAYQTEIIGTGRLIAHSYIKDQWLLFTETSVYTMTYVGKPEIWLIKELTVADGIMSPKSVIQTNDAVMWFGHKDLWIYNGSVLSQIPNNTMKLWLYDTINMGKYYLSFVRKSVSFNEFWIHFPGGSASEPDTYVIWNYDEGHFTNGTLSRTAAEESQNSLPTQWLADGSCNGSPASTLYRHEVGFSANGANLTGFLTSNYVQIDEGDYLQQITRIVPSTQLLPIGAANTGQTLYQINMYTKEYDGDPNPRSFGPYTVTAQTTKLETRISGRQRQYKFVWDTQNGFRVQKMLEEIKPSTVR